MRSPDRKTASMVLGLAGWGGVLAYLCTGDRLSAVLHPSFRPLVPVAAGVLFLMILGLLLFPERQACGCCCHDHGHDHGDDHHDDQEHHHGGALGLWRLIVLVLPVWGMFLMRPEGYGLETMLRRGIMDDPSAMDGTYRVPNPPQDPAAMQQENLGGDVVDFLDQIPKTPDGAWPMAVTDLLYAMDDEALRAKLETGRVEVVGQRVAADRNNPRGNRLMLVRMMMVCCAADARPVGILVEIPQGLPPGKEMGWLRVNGKVAFPLEGGKHVAMVIADSVEPMEPPKEQYVY